MSLRRCDHSPRFPFCDNTCRTCSYEWATLYTITPMRGPARCLLDHGSPPNQSTAFTSASGFNVTLAMFTRIPILTSMVRDMIPTRHVRSRRSVDVAARTLVVIA